MAATSISRRFLQCSGRRRLADRQKESGGSENQSRRNLEMARENTSALRRLFFFCRRPADYFFMSKGEKSIVIIKLWSCISIIGFVQFIISNSFFTM